ncbi:hypothetical protein COCC4DRAFT_198202 [Bipolaris maydis ATCC 48331]|uniref:Uncharacterized protein n=2 Tax=Cochliobolus heterostrophus TaxID=5016 RepID=M2UU23_COCH5|nr:uncharacterized protein COCC4DRAFT_198202 [Bipolaris maydis ATCC 48331]EMD97086.1 hypothetical protein COCHEDRAFT_1085169 [Bipolaris maydis C5]ENI04448.1 hypothetical protein COCC4DRAFT_198202 [Bipolaris maydis ATCC 48331]
MSTLHLPPLTFGNSVTSPCSSPKACFSFQSRAPKLSIRPTPCLGSLGNCAVQETSLATWPFA